MKSRLALACAALAVTVGCSNAADQAQPTAATARAAFDHYEPIRVALANDSMDGVSTHAAAMAPAAEKAGGAKAKQAVDALATSKSIQDARQHFATVSDVLLPVFLNAKLADVNAFTCPMIHKSWVQKGEEMGNPYFGKSMLTCGSPYKPKT
jgi:hypothetical protein